MQEEHKKVDINSQEFQMELSKTREFAENVRQKMGFFPNPIESENERIYIGLTNNKLTKDKRFCPCFMVVGETPQERKEADNRICPCKPALNTEIPEHGRCHCGIFCTAEYVENFKENKIQEIAHSNDLEKVKLENLFEKLEINATELVDLLDGRKQALVAFTLVDVREVMENNNKRIIGTDFLIPTSNFYAQLQQIADKKDEKIVVYCHSGSRSYQVQQAMKSMGYKIVINLTGGISRFGGDTE